MKGFIKNNIIGFILGGLIFGSIGVYAATTYKSNLIIYESKNGEKTVEDALNDLYSIKSKGNAIAANLSEGKTAIVQGQLITGTGEDSKNQYTSGYNAGISDGKTQVNFKVTNELTTRGTGGKSTSFVAPSTRFLVFANRAGGYSDYGSGSNFTISGALTATALSGNNGSTGGDSGSIFNAYKIFLVTANKGANITVTLPSSADTVGWVAVVDLS